MNLKQTNVHSTYAYITKFIIITLYSLKKKNKKKLQGLSNLLGLERSITMKSD